MVSSVCLSVVIRLLSSYCSTDYSRLFLYNLAVIPDWSWEEVSVASTYSSAILGLSDYIINDSEVKVLGLQYF